MATELSGVKKSAILLLSLDPDQAAEILKRLPPDAVEEVSREIASLGEIGIITRKEVFAEFYNTALAHAYLSEGGLEHAKTLLLKSLSQHDAERVIKQVTQQVRPRRSRSCRRPTARTCSRSSRTSTRRRSR